MISKIRIGIKNQLPDFRGYRMEWLWDQLIKADSYQPDFPWELCGRSLFRRGAAKC